MDTICHIQLYGYINDTYNISNNVGHRTSMLDLEGNQISFGQCGGYSAASIYTTSSDLGNNEKFYAYPTPGYFPIDNFEMSNDYETNKLQDTKWSITIPYKAYNIDTSKLKLKITYNEKVYDITGLGYDSYTKTIFWNLPTELKSELTEGTNKLVAGKKVDIELKGLVDENYNNVTIKYWTEFFIANQKEATGYIVFFNGGMVTDSNGQQTCTANEGEEKDVLVQTIPNDAQDKRYIIEIENKNLAAYNEQTKKIKFLKSGKTNLYVKRKSDGKILTTVILDIKQSQCSVEYRTHVQKEGWQAWKKNGEMAGTEGKSYRLEAIQIKANGTNLSGGIEYSTHVQREGWQSWKKNGETSGTEGKKLRLEAIKIRLTGDISQKYDIYYRVHAQKFGWLDWAKNGEPAGTEGYSYRLEAIEIMLVVKGGKAPGSTANAFKKFSPSVVYKTHVQNIGWQKEVKDGTLAGTEGKKLRLEGIKISLDSSIAGGIEYKTHIQRLGWEEQWKANGALSGTEGKKLRLEAIQIRLTGEIAQKYDIYYRVHSQKFGWLDWAKNGEAAGTSGYGYRLEGIQIELVAKGGKAPGKTENTYKKK